MSKMTDRLTKKALPAAGGGVASKFVASKIVPEIKKMIPARTTPLKAGETDFIQVGLDLLPAIGGMFLLNDKDDAYSYLGAGMIGASIGDTAKTMMPEFLSDEDNRLADQVDELLKSARAKQKVN